MLTVKKKIDRDGGIAMKEALKIAKIQPGDLVEITPGDNKITIKVSKKNKPKGVVRAAAGILKEQPELVEEMLRIREEEDDRPDTIP